MQNCQQQYVLSVGNRYGFLCLSMFFYVSITSFLKLLLHVEMNKAECKSILFLSIPVLLPDLD